MANYAYNCNKKNYDFWYNILYNFIISVRTWEGDVFEGISPRCNGTFINRCNITRGYVFAFEDEDGKFFIAPAGKVFYDYMRLPEAMTISDPHITKSVINRTVGIDCIYIPLNGMGKPINWILKVYAERLAQISDDSIMNSLFSRSELFYKVSDDASANKVRAMIDDIIHGKLGIIIDDNLMTQLVSGDSDGKIRSISQSIQYKGYDYQVMILETLKEFFQILGISANGGNLMKKEHSIAAEVNSNNEQIAMFRNFFTVETEKAIDRVNEMFGTNITTQYGLNDIIEGRLDYGTDESQLLQRDLSGQESIQ